MRMLAYYLTDRTVRERLERAQRIQAAWPWSEEIDRLLIAPRGHDLGVDWPRLDVDWIRDGAPCFSDGKNAAIRYALQKGYEWLIDLDADTVLLQPPKIVPASGYACVRCHFSGPTEDLSPFLRGEMPAPSGCGFYGSSRFLLADRVIRRFRYEPSFRGYGGEDVDLHETLGFFGVHQEPTSALGLHVWHPTSDRPADMGLLGRRRLARSEVLRRAERIEGWMATEELAWLGLQAACRRSIVEVGSYKGRSTTALAGCTAGTVYAVDLWSTEKVGEDFRRNLAPEIRSGRCVPIQAESGAAVETVRTLVEARGAPVDMVFIDGDHAYESVRRDIDLWLPLLGTGGLICGHDFVGGFMGVVQAVDERFPDRRVWPGSIWHTEIL